MRFGLALALICAVLVVLYVPPVFRQFAQQLRGHDVAPARDLKSMFHSAGDTI
jgi:hypothetical protein